MFDLIEEEGEITAKQEPANLFPNLIVLVVDKEIAQLPLLRILLVFVFERTIENTSTGTETRRVDEGEIRAETLPEYFEFTATEEEETSEIVADPARLVFNTEAFDRTIEQDPFRLSLRRLEGRSDSVHDPVNPPAVD